MSSHGNKPVRGAVVIMQMIFCATGIFATFFIWSVMQERVATKAYEVDGQQRKFKFFFVLNFFQALCASTVGAVMWSGSTLLSRTAPGTSTPHPSHSSEAGRNSRLPAFPYKEMASIGFTVTFGSPMGYAAMSRISYPVVLTVKMCKMIPIIVVGVLWHGTRYSPIKYVDCLLVTAGVAAFTMLGEDDGGSADTKSSLLGILLVFLNIVFDGYTNSSQDAIVRKFHWPGNKIMTITNMNAAVWLAATILISEYLPPNPIISPQLYDAINFLSEQPAALHDIVTMGCLNALGQFFIFQTISLFDSLTVTTMTLVRKVGSVLLSIVLHDHRPTTAQWASLVAIFGGVVLDAHIAIQDRKARGKLESASKSGGAETEHRDMRHDHQQHHHHSAKEHHGSDHRANGLKRD